MEHITLPSVIGINLFRIQGPIMGRTWGEQNHRGKCSGKFYIGLKSRNFSSIITSSVCHLVLSQYVSEINLVIPRDTLIRNYFAISYHKYILYLSCRQSPSYRLQIGSFIGLVELRFPHKSFLSWSLQTAHCAFVQIGPAHSDFLF